MIKFRSFVLTKKHQPVWALSEKALKIDLVSEQE